MINNNNNTHSTSANTLPIDQAKVKVKVNTVVVQYSMCDFMLYYYIGLVYHRIEHSTHALNANKVIMNHYIFKCTTTCQKSKLGLIFSTNP